MFATTSHTKKEQTGANTGHATPFFQPKLTVNTPGDAHEQEADAVADQVMRMREGDMPVVQRKSITPVVQRACAHCEAEKEKEKEGVQRKETGGSDAGGKTAPSIVSDVLSSGGGQSIDGGTRQFMESRFGQDFSSVRIHTGAQAAESASAIQARAYTSGRDVVFGAGEYQPGTESGKRLLAHELTHVGQQGKAVRRSRGSDSSDSRTGVQTSGTSRPATRPPSLIPCTFQVNPIVNRAAGKINTAILGLQEILSNWGHSVTSPLQLATANALRLGYNIEYDKSLQLLLTRELRLGDERQIRARDASDRASSQIILNNFQILQQNIPLFLNAPACVQGMQVGTVCVGCRPATFSNCERGGLAHVLPEAMGRNVGPILFCPSFTEMGPEEQAEAFIHEMAHLASFAASDFNSGRQSRYYGCPVRPESPNGPGITDPAELIRIADTYRCFVETQRTNFRFFRDNVGTQQPAYSAADRPKVEEIKNFLVFLPPRIQGIINASSPVEPWVIPTNPHIQSMQSMLQQLIADLTNENLTIRIDPALQTGNVAASYDFLNNIIRVKPFQNESERNHVVEDLFHEYTHVRQDMTAEQALAQQQSPHVHTRQEDLAREIEARRQQVYFSWFMRNLGFRSAATQAGFNRELSDRVFLGRFERERNAASPRERRTATQELTSEIETNYDAQLTRNSSVKTYIIQVSNQDHAMLFHNIRGRNNPEDLGQVPLPVSIMGIDELSRWLEEALGRLAYFNDLFRRTRNSEYNILTFFVSQNNRKITEFGIEAPQRTQP